MKVLFLDHDGVICLEKQWGSRKNSNQKFDKFDQKAIKVLNEIIERTKCKIVVSSDWRLYCDLNEMKALYRDRGIIETPFDFTPIHSVQDFNFDKLRIKEITSWVEENKPDLWCAVDDMNMKDLNFFVHTPLQREGIKQSGIKEKIIKILGEENVK